MTENEQYVDFPEDDAEVVEFGECVLKELSDTVGEAIKPDTNVLNVANLTDQALKLSNNEEHKKTLDMIRKDPSLSTEEKLQLISEEDARQQNKIEAAAKQLSETQSSQVKAYYAVLVPYLKMGGVMALAVVLGNTPVGREFLTTVISNAVKDLPRWRGQ